MNNNTTTLIRTCPVPTRRSSAIGFGFAVLCLLNNVSGVKAAFAQRPVPPEMKMPVAPKQSAPSSKPVQSRAEIIAGLRYSTRISAFGRSISKEQERNDANLYLKGLNKGSSKRRTDLIQALKTGDMTHTALAQFALVRLGAPEALPILAQQVKLSPQGTAYMNKPGYARLAADLATRRVGSNTDSGQAERAKAFLDRFLLEAGLEAKDLKTARSAADEEAKTQKADKGAVALVSLRQLADRIYVNRDLALAEEIRSRGVEFAQDPPSAYKVRLAPLSTPERAKTLVEDLAAKRVLRTEEYYAIQLAISEGELVFEGAAQKLAEMDQHPEDYKSPGYSALFQILAGSGNPAYAETIARYVIDGPTWKSSMAKVMYPFLKEGVPRYLGYEY